MANTAQERLYTPKDQYDTSCAEIPDKTGVYFVLVPQGMDIRFRPTAVNRHAPFYGEDVLLEKYRKCGNKTIYILEKPAGKRDCTNGFGSI